MEEIEKQVACVERLIDANRLPSRETAIMYDILVTLRGLKKRKRHRKDMARIRRDRIANGQCPSCGVGLTPEYRRRLKQCTMCLERMAKNSRNFRIRQKALKTAGMKYQG